MRINLSEAAGVRYLHFGSEWVQGAMRIARPWSLELEYTREMMACLLLRPEARWPRRVLLAGLGAGSLAKFLHRHRPQARLTAVEIEPQVVAVAQQSFKLPPEDNRFKIVIDDAAEFILRGTSRYDLILVDGFDAKARAGPLDTLPFYQACRARLSDEGLLAVNLLNRSRGYGAASERIATAFAGRSILFPSCDSGNAIAFAASGDAVSMSLGELKTAARQLKQETRLDLLPTLTRLEHSARCVGGMLRL